MKFDWVIDNFRESSFFDLFSLTQLSGEKRPTVLNQLSRWSKSGKIIPLRRGVYILAEKYQKEPIAYSFIANIIYQPSYLSTEWALSFYGLFPEKADLYTCVTTRTTKNFNNILGNFKYQHVKSKLFFGFTKKKFGKSEYLLAEPEKALLDFLYLSRGPWDKHRIIEIRLGSFQLINKNKIFEWAKMYPEPVRQSIKMIYRHYDLVDTGREI